MKRRSLGIATLCLFAAGVAAAEIDSLPQVHALTGVRIVAAPGRTIEQGTVVLRDGVIVEVGTGVSPPPDARIWDLEGLTVYPGLVEPYTVRSWPGGEENDGKRPQGGDDNPLLTPERDMTLHASEEGEAGKLRKAGYTTALVAPEKGLFRGRSVLINLGDGSVNQNLLRRDVAQHAGLGHNSFLGGYPTSMMGAIALLRQTLVDAEWYQRAQAVYQTNPAQARPAINTALEALGPVGTGSQVLVVETETALDNLLLADLADELDLVVYLVGNGEEYRWLDEIANSRLPHILPLNFPELPKVGKKGKDDRGVGLEELRHWDLAPENPKKLLDAGLQVAFTTFGLDDAEELHARVATAMEAGLTADEALAALTTTPADLFDLSDRAGTIEAGKMANLVVVDGDLFVSKPKVQEVWIDGMRYEIEEPEPDEAEANDKSPDHGVDATRTGIAGSDLEAEP